MSKSFVSQALFWLLALLVVGAVVVRFYAYFINEDFDLYAQIPCNPAEATCFINDCDPSNEECDVTPFMFAEMSASKAPDCFEENNCVDFACPSDDEACLVMECSEDVLYEGVICLEVDKNTTLDSEFDTDSTPEESEMQDTTEL